MLSLTCLKTAVSVALLSLTAFALAAQTPDANDRVLNTGWKFIRQDAAGAQAPNFDDSQWQAISLPHTWNAQDGQDGGNNYYRGPGWYRSHFTIDATDTGKRFYLRFEGASLAAVVYVNGQSAGSHNGGFAAFCFDVTALVHPGDNLLAVRVDNSLNPDIPPLSGDFTVFGGLYRNVHLLIRNPLCVSPTDDASPGVYLKPVHVDDSSAQIQATAKLRNDTDTDQTITAHFTVADADGHVVAAEQTEPMIAAHTVADAQVTLAIANPRLWNGREDPYLYQATVELSAAGQVVDRVTQPLGLRYYRVDAQEGFFLNGRHYALHGVDRHQDHLDMGWTAGPAQIDEDYGMIREMGCTAVRLAHYQHPDYEYTVCDRSGIVVWAELAMVNRITASAAFSDNARQQLRELIKQNYNHPSICFWSMYNELDSNTRPRWLLVQQLNDLAHQLDPDRLTVAATHLDPKMAVNWMMDISGFNLYYGWYNGTIADWPTGLDRLHAAYPNNAIGISEYGAGASIYQHENPPATQPIAKGHWHPEEWQSTVHEAAWAAMSRRPWLWGTYVWVMFDFASDGRDEGDHPGRNDKGLVTADRKVKKDAFYFYKANWTTDPFVYITSKRYDPRPAGTNQLKVYSNCDTVELLLNGRSLGRRSNQDHVFLWSQALLPAGPCNIQAIGEKNGHTYTDSCRWNTIATTQP